MVLTIIYISPQLNFRKISRSHLLFFGNLLFIVNSLNHSPLYHIYFSNTVFFGRTEKKFKPVFVLKTNI
uniref:Ovule protein n=1 Tax=Panagrolaimus sp. PS1159 TaxID=55785 RepID=A0AC35FCW5_9BILA